MKQRSKCLEVFLSLFHLHLKTNGFLLLKIRIAYLDVLFKKKMIQKLESARIFCRTLIINGNAHHIKLSNNAVRKCGFGTDAIQTITAYAFTTLRLHCVYAEIIEYNEPSKKLFEKCGYIFDGVLKSRVFKKGNYWDVYVYSIQSKKN